MRLSWIFLYFALLAAVPLLTAGCGGVNASKTVSPLDFLLPGIIQADPKPASPAAPLPTSVQV